MQLKLTKATVIEQLTGALYLVEDLYNKDEIKMSISGKMRMNYFKLNAGDVVYVAVSTIEPNKGRLVNETDFKQNRALSRLREELGK